MKKSIHRRSSHAWLVTLVILFLAVCEPMIEQIGTGQAMANNKQSTLWQVTQALAQQMPLSKDRLENVLATKLSLKVQDEHRVHWSIRMRLNPLGI
jgi:hypothetical protein